MASPPDDLPFNHDMHAMQMRGRNTQMVKHALLHTAPTATQLQQLRVVRGMDTRAHTVNVNALVKQPSRYSNSMLAIELQHRQLQECLQWHSADAWRLSCAGMH